jgi:hypothetical protein
MPTRLVSVLRCHVLGHHFRFSSEADSLAWRCERGCGAGGSKKYGSAEDASRYARAFDREDSADLGRRAPLFGLFPLRILRAFRRRKDG